MKKELEHVAGKLPPSMPEDGLLAVCVCRNEELLIPWFLDYYRSQGVDWFLFIDNASTDATRKILSEADDVTVFSTKGSYVEAANGRLWSTEIAKRFALNRWCLTLDVDEILVYPMSEHIHLKNLTEWLTEQGCDAFLTIMIDMYQSFDKVYTPGKVLLRVVHTLMKDLIGL